MDGRPERQPASAGSPTAPLRLLERACPICATAAFSRLYAPANVEPEALDRFAFASRKPPELMHHQLRHCDRCDLLYADPAPGPEDLRRAYADAAYDSGEAAGYAARTYRRLLDRLLEGAADRGSGAAVDVGAGDGAFLAELIDAGFGDAFGIEPSRAPRSAAVPELRPRLRSEPFESIEIEPASLDLITCMATIEHLDDPLAFCERSRELLREDGLLLLTCHDRRSKLNRALARRSPIFDIEHLQLFAFSSARALLERAGFRAIHVRPFINRYPLRYCLRLLGVPGMSQSGSLGRLGGLPLPVPAGNLAVVGRAPPLP